VNVRYLKRGDYMRKYRNKKVVIDGITFDSRREANRYRELKLLEKADKIQGLELQKEFVLIPAQYETYERYGKKGQRLKDGERCVERACIYKADFVYYENGETVVEDTKGMRTKEYIIKRKLMLLYYGIKIREV
jgi:hypothetical protein